VHCNGHLELIAFLGVYIDVVTSTSAELTPPTPSSFTHLEDHNLSFAVSSLRTLNERLRSSK
jgi:hypothetical protein